MKRLLFCTLALALLVTACQIRELQTETPLKSQNEVILNAYAEGTPKVKTGLDANHHFTWTPGDQIMVFSGGESSLFTAINQEPSAAAKFRGQVWFVMGHDETGDISYSWALYPYNSNAVYNEPEGISKTAIITTEITDTQIGKAGTFADGYAVALGRAETLDIYFKNAYSGFFITFSRPDITAVTLRSMDGESLAGTYSIGLDNAGVPYVVPGSVSNGSDSVTLIAPDGGTFEVGKRYYIITLPDVSISTGVSFTLYRSDGYKGTYNLISQRPFQRNLFRNLTDPLDVRVDSWVKGLPYNALGMAIDGDFSDWDALDQSVISVATCASSATHDALQSLKVCADPYYIYLLLEWDPAQIAWSDSDLVPLHIHLNGDGHVNTGGGDLFSDHCADYLYEGFLTDGQQIVSYSPEAYVWTGEPNGLGWFWVAPDYYPTSELAIGAGYNGKYEIRLDRSQYPGVLADRFSIGVDIQQDWENVGYLPNNGDDSAPMLWVNTSGIKDNSVNGHGWVDMGDGLKWATCNIGANKPWDFGDYFAWGELEPKGDYSYTTYSMCNGDNNSMTKYCSKSTFGYNGFTDSLVELIPSDDAAVIKWGSPWRIPTEAEWQNLKDTSKYSWIWSDDYNNSGHSGVIVTSIANGRSIFIPAAGYMTSDVSVSVGVIARYWSSSLSTGYPSNAVGPHIDLSNQSVRVQIVGGYRSVGRPIRPVYE